MTDAADVERFIRAMRDWGICYADWAGGTQILANDRDVVNRELCPEAGDWIVYDARGRSGFVGVPHDEWAAVRPIKLKPAARKDFDLSLPEIPRATPTTDLMRRYIWIANVFIDWFHVDGGSPFDIWATPEDIDDAYAAEASSFPKDPWLATYWLLHFGLCYDPRYGDVATAIRSHKLDQTFDKARWTLAFFDSADLSVEIDLSPPPSRRRKDGDYRGLFLRRRANLLYMTYSYAYRGAGVPAEHIWRSVSLYRARDRLAIQRMRWLGNNLQKHDLWETLSPHLETAESDDVPYIAYARALRPGTPESGPAADAFVSELANHPEGWRAQNADWAKVMLWEVRSHATDQAALKAAALAVFDGDLGSAQFADILAALGEQPAGDPLARAALADYEALFDGVRSLRSEPPERLTALIGQADAALARLSETTLSFFVDAAQQRGAVHLLWRFLMLGGPGDREGMLTRLTPRVAIADYDLKFFFSSETPTLISSREDPVYKALLRVFNSSVGVYSSDYAHKNGLRMIGALLSAVAHLPGVFEDLVGLIDAATPNERSNTLFNRVFKKTFDKPVDPIMALEKVQVERLLEAVVGFIRRHPRDCREARRTIYYCANPEAVDWVKERLANPDFFKDFEAHDAAYDPLPVALKQDLEGALSWHKNRR